MTMAIASSNGLSRIGRLVFHTAFEGPQAGVVRINDPYIGAEHIAHLLEYSHVHRRYEGAARANGGQPLS
jgi:glyceraldehyde-3-phosphate dehydrogenase/erythrose-4-phosphate dehydrogenase